MNGAHTTLSFLPYPPDRPRDRYGRPLPPATVALLIQLQVMLVYARHVLCLLERAAACGLSLFARCFGSAQAAFVLTNLTRGILRAIALERVLLARAEGEPNPAAGTPRKRNVPAPQGAAPRTSRGQFQGLPTLGQLEAAIRRRPVECAADAIRRDLGICLSLCEARFGNALRDMAAAYRETIANCFNAFPRRETAVADAPERKSTFALPPQIPDAIRYIVGCLGAQQPVCGFPFTASPVGAAIDGAEPP